MILPCISLICNHPNSFMILTQEPNLSFYSLLHIIKNILKGTEGATKEDSQILARDLRVRYKIVPGLEINISRSLEEKKSKKILEIIRLIKSNF